jgi:hypothetical protein
VSTDCVPEGSGGSLGSEDLQAAEDIAITKAAASMQSRLLSIFGRWTACASDVPLRIMPFVT